MTLDHFRLCKNLWLRGLKARRLIIIIWDPMSKKKVPSYSEPKPPTREVRFDVEQPDQDAEDVSDEAWAQILLEAQDPNSSTLQLFNPRFFCDVCNTDEHRMWECPIVLQILVAARTFKETVTALRMLAAFIPK